MYDGAISIKDWCFSLCAAVRAELTAHEETIHPSGACVLREWMSDIIDAAIAGDHARVSGFAAVIREKIALELEWAEESEGSARDVARR